jgi:outer membrane protein OmpA-like peptidoglycan-associated protein
MALAFAACGSSPAATPPPPHEASLPAFSVPSRQDVVGQLQEGRSPDPIDVSASAFDLGKSFPNTDHPEWQAMLAALAGARDEVLKDGFVIEVVGYADSSGSTQQNACLSKARADVTRQKLLEDAKYPPDSVAAFGGGVSGDTPAARRVEVKIVKSFDRAPCPTDPNSGSDAPCC